MATCIATSAFAISLAAPLVAGPAAAHPARLTSGSDAAHLPGCPTPPTGFVLSAPGAGKTVALTFDDGPGAADLQIADVLRREKIPGTFFFTGAGASANPDVVRQITAQGLAVGNHSYDHLYPAQVPGGWTQQYVADQAHRTNAALTRVTREPVCLYRPPGGFQEGVLAATSALRLTAALWSVDPRDWAQPTTASPQATAAIVEAATDIGHQTHPIVLLHSSHASASVQHSGGPGYRGNTVAALPQIIAWYRTHGFRFVDLAGRSAP